MVTDPITPAAAAATVLVTGAAVPVLTIFGVSLGIQADILLAGFVGSVCAMGLLNTVPSSGDTLANLVQTTLKRIIVALCSSMVAGYMTPAIARMFGMTESAYINTFAFLLGAGAQTLLPIGIEMLAEAMRRFRGLPPKGESA